MTDLRIKPLGRGDAAALSHLVTSDPPVYRRFFTPFPSGQADIDGALENADKDVYWGVFVESDLAGLVMLRGLDAGFGVPAFGVYVAERYAGRGLGSVALAFAESWCRLFGYLEIMLTVHPEDERARRLYENHGFGASGECSNIGYLVYRKQLDRS